MSDDEIARRLRESATDRRLRTRPLRIDRMIAGGTADGRALEEEPGVQYVFVKPENLPYQR